MPPPLPWCWSFSPLLTHCCTYVVESVVWCYRAVLLTAAVLLQVRDVILSFFMCRKVDRLHAPGIVYCVCAHDDRLGLWLRCKMRCVEDWLAITVPIRLLMRWTLYRCATDPYTNLTIPTFVYYCHTLIPGHRAYQKPVLTSVKDAEYPKGEQSAENNLLGTCAIKYFCIKLSWCNHFCVCVHSH